MRTERRRNTARPPRAAAISRATLRGSRPDQNSSVTSLRWRFCSTNTRTSTTTTSVGRSRVQARPTRLGGRRRRPSWTTAGPLRSRGKGKTCRARSGTANLRPLAGGLQPHHGADLSVRRIGGRGGRRGGTPPKEGLRRPRLAHALVVAGRRACLNGIPDFAADSCRWHLAPCGRALRALFDDGSVTSTLLDDGAWDDLRVRSKP